MILVFVNFFLIVFFLANSNFSYQSLFFVNHILIKLTEIQDLSTVGDLVSARRILAHDQNVCE